MTHSRRRCQDKPALPVLRAGVMTNAHTPSSLYVTATIPFANGPAATSNSFANGLATASNSFTNSKALAEDSARFQLSVDT